VKTVRLQVERENVLDDTTWEFGRPGWWVTHAVLIAGAVYLGYRLTRRDA
jgi:hypothetical protein